MEIRTATLADLDQVNAVEAACFPPAEAATQAEFKERLTYYGNHFWLLFDDEGKIIGFIDGFVTDQKDLTDDMYAQAQLHNERGKWQMIFGLNTLPEYRRHGYGGKLIRALTAAAKKQGRKGVVLTCKERLIPYYQHFGFKNEGLSRSVHGGATWYQMRLTF